MKNPYIHISKNASGWKHFLPIAIFAWLLLAFAQPAIAQRGVSEKAKENFHIALANFTKRDYKKAETHCNKAIELAPQWHEPYVLLGDIYRTQKLYEKEAGAYMRMLEAMPENYIGYYNLGDVYSKMGNLEEAIANYEIVQTLSGVPSDHKAYAEKRVKEIGFAKKMKDKPVPFDPKNMGANINSNVEDYFPTFTVDGETMYFTRRKLVDSFQMRGQSGYLHRYNEDIMMSKKQGSGWSVATEVPGSINTDANEGAMTIAPDGSYMIFTACDREEGFGSCDLYISFFIDGNWTKAINMQEPINTRFKETQPSISYDGRTIYFASSRAGSKGGLDIWMSTRDENWNFGMPVNLGPAVNTKEDDQSPFIHTDDQTLYFVSRGHLGMGMNDIFVSRRNASGGWDSAVNIGYPINTTEDEPGLIVDRPGEYGYISSSGEGTLGGLDIFYFKIPKEAKPKPVTFLKGKVFDVYTKAALMAKFEVIDLETGKTINTSSTGKDGNFLVTLPGGKNYMLNVSAKGYLFNSQNLQLKDYTKTEPYQKDIGLHPIKAGEKIALNNIFFNTNSFELRSESKNELNKLVQFMKENATLKVEIGGHTDNSGNATANMTLSQNRAKAVYDYLIKEGIAANRLSWKGYGQTQPIALNTTEEGKQLNRRTEVKVVE